MKFLYDSSAKNFLMTSNFVYDFNLSRQSKIHSFWRPGYGNAVNDALLQSACIENTQRKHDFESSDPCTGPSAERR